MTFGIRVAIGLMCCAAASAQTQLFVNELHYDNAGEDLNETIEVAGPAGTDLSGFSLVLYNGSGGTSYATLPLGGTLADQCGGFGTQAVAAPGLQNGAPDGFALVNSAGQVLQFLSYEGSFTASNGPAAGLTSTDIGVSEGGSGSATASLALTGSGSSYEDFSWGVASNASFGACNPQQTFTGGVDNAPVVMSTIPANGASAAATDTNVTIAFSEPVSVTGEWFGIACSVSGKRGTPETGVSSANSRTFTLDPNTDFAPGESCTVTIHAAGVRDLDGTPDPPASDFAFSFSTAVDSAPIVMTVSPADGATGVGTGSLITVTFSEPVDAASGAFALSCGGAGQAIVLSGGPSRFTLDPAADLPEESSCTLAITAALVLDRDGTPDPMAADFASGFFTGIGSGDYYLGVDASNAASLRTTLHAVIKDHMRYPYTDDVGIDTWDILEQADEDPLASTRILDVYRNATYAKAGGGNSSYNREHTWPNSLGFPNNVPENSAYTDTHMLMLSDIGHNSARGNLAFGNCTAGETFATLAYFGQGGTGHANLRCGAYWHVWDALRGNIARAILYMDIRYEGGSHGITGAPEPDLRLTDNAALIAPTGGNASVAYMGLLTVVLQWHAEDPPDERERLRNGIVQSYQGNRNPFVDHPEWAACLYLSQCAASMQNIFSDGFE